LVAKPGLFNLLRNIGPYKLRVLMVNAKIFVDFL
jgi:hypothetical protein